MFLIKLLMLIVLTIAMYTLGFILAYGVNEIRVLTLIACGLCETVLYIPYLLLNDLE